MVYSLLIPDYLDRIFFKLAKKNKKGMQILDKKIQQILENPHHFKPLRGGMVGVRRVHIGKSFVLTFEILEEQKVVRLLDFDHHDKVYR